MDRDTYRDKRLAQEADYDRRQSAHKDAVIDKLNAELATLRSDNERLREALEGVYACHGSNPSDAMADMPEIDYIKYTLMTARRIAKEALK